MAHRGTSLALFVHTSAIPGAYSFVLVGDQTIAVMRGVMVFVLQTSNAALLCRRYLFFVRFCNVQGYLANLVLPRRSPLVALPCKRFEGALLWARVRLVWLPVIVFLRISCSNQFLRAHAWSSLASWRCAPLDTVSYRRYCLTGRAARRYSLISLQKFVV